jgi:hypothetical protein
MRMSAAIGSCDEVEFIGPLLEHLRAIGVGHIIGADAGSTDGTAEALRAAPGHLGNTASRGNGNRLSSRPRLPRRADHWAEGHAS